MLNYAIIAFAVVFFVVGIFRIVEFREADINSFQRKFLIPLHLIGTLLFAFAIGMLGWDPEQKQMHLMAGLFFSGFLILFPLHIYTAIKRRLKISNQTANH